MRTIGALSWITIADLKGPVATVPVDFSVDGLQRINVRGSLYGNPVEPKVVVIDNTGNNQNITITINGVGTQVAASIRQTSPVPSGLQYLDLQGASGITTATFYANPADAPPDAPNYQAIIQAAVAATMIPGGMIMWPAAVAPAGWLICDGSPVSRAANAALFAAIGITWGAGDGLTTFNVPDCRDRFPLGVSVGGLGGQRATARALGSTGGEETHTITLAESPAHTHTGVTGGQSADHTHVGNGAWYANVPSGRQVVLGGGVFCDLPNVDGDAIQSTAGSSNDHTHTIASAGGGNAFDKMPNYFAINFIIKT